MPKISQSDLKDGDVFLYHGTAFISRLIRLLDGGVYSHASIFHSEHVTEALAPGIVVNTVEASVLGAKYVDVFRFVKNSGFSAAVPVVNVNSQTDWFEAHHERYAYEQILLLALLCSTRRIARVLLLPGAAMFLRNALDSATEVVNRLFAAGKEPVICSELVYRCFKQAGEAYSLTILGADAPGAVTVETTPDAVEAQEVLDSAHSFLVAYTRAKGAALDSHSLESVSVAAVSDFVTPHDLGRTPDLKFIGTLESGVPHVDVFANEQELCFSV